MKKITIGIVCVLILAGLFVLGSRFMTTPPADHAGGEVAPDIGSEAKPEPTPDVQPSVTPETEKQPEPTPEVSTTPEPEKTPEVTPAPEVTPGPSPSVEPTPEVTPEPELTPTPEPSVQPEPTPEPAPTPSTQPGVAEPTPEVTPSPEPTPAPTENTETPDPEVSTGTQTEQERWGDGTNVRDYITDVGVNYDQMYADWAANQTPMTITYGKARYNRPAVAGDTYIKKDGTKIVLKMGPSGVVGEGQGVSADLLLVWGSDQVRDHIVHGGGQFRFDNTAIGNDQCGLTSTGAPLMGQMYQVNATTGEGHFESEWGAIMHNSIYTKYIAGVDGEYRGQVSSDPMHLWVWDGTMWRANFTGYKWN